MEKEWRGQVPGDEVRRPQSLRCWPHGRWHHLVVAGVEVRQTGGGAREMVDDSDEAGGRHGLGRKRLLAFSSFFKGRGNDGLEIGNNKSSFLTRQTLRSRGGYCRSPAALCVGGPSARSSRPPGNVLVHILHLSSRPTDSRGEPSNLCFDNR